MCLAACVVQVINLLESGGFRAWCEQVKGDAVAEWKKRATRWAPGVCANEVPALQGLTQCLSHSLPTACVCALCSLCGVSLLTVHVLQVPFENETEERLAETRIDIFMAEVRSRTTVAMRSAGRSHHRGRLPLPACQPARWGCRRWS